MLSYLERALRETEGENTVQSKRAGYAPATQRWYSPHKLGRFHLAAQPTRSQG